MSASEIYRRQNIGQRVGYGERPALLIVDFVNGFNDPEQLGGGNISAAIENTQGLLEIARQRNIPIAFTRIVYEPNAANVGAFCRKMPSLVDLTEHCEASQIVPQLRPRPGENIVRKTQPSAFFGTDLASWFVWKGVDTVIVTGCTTSGCVRATVIDAVSWNFRVGVPRDCVGDRAIEPHEANLFDMDAKYADVQSVGEVGEYLANLRRV